MAHSAADQRSTTRSISRRGFLAAGAGALALAGLTWSPAGAVPWGPQSTLPAPPAFPAGIPLSQQAYARHADDVVTLANWARENGYTLRARGTMHGWSPLTVVAGEPVDRVLLVDTMVHLNAVAIHSAGPHSTVTAGSGASVKSILTALQGRGLGWANSPAIGDLSIAGALAIGATYPAAGETVTPGQSFGSLSNLITALTAVVWDDAAGSYVLREFARTDSESTAFLTHLGRTFITSVTLQAGENYRLRCQSFTDIPWRELFAPPGSPGRTYESFVEEVHGPYNYFFSDNLSETGPRPWGRLPGACRFYLRHTTVRVVAGGGAVITKRSNIARVIHEMTSWLNERMTHYASKGQYAGAVGIPS